MASSRAVANHRRRTSFDRARKAIYEGIVTPAASTGRRPVEDHSRLHYR